MKKIIGVVIAVIVVIIILALLGAGLGFGPGNGTGNGEGGGTRNNTSSTISESVDSDESEATEADETEGTADNSSKLITIAVSVCESDYLYQNKKISLDALIKELENIDEDFVIEVTDDNASLKAYNKLIDALEERSINYTEK